MPPRAIGLPGRYILEISNPSAGPSEAEVFGAAPIRPGFFTGLKRSSRNSAGPTSKVCGN